MNKKWFSRKHIGFILLVFLCIFTFFLAGGRHVSQVGLKFLYSDVKETPVRQVALVLGARVYSDGRMSDIVLDRVSSALSLYKAGKVEKILVSGDHGQEEYDEVNTMKGYFLRNGVPGEDIFLDHAGFDTYDSVYRAQEIFGVSSVIVVTQRFHLPRAVYIARAKGMDAVGFVADRQEYLAARYNEVREFLARMKSFSDVFFSASPQFLGEKISINGDGRESWD